MAQSWMAVMILVLVAGTLFAQDGHSGEVLYESGFAEGAPDWTPIDKATVSAVSRRAEGASLRLRQYSNEEAGSAWLSPVFANPGQPVRISLWAADNYRSCKDFSFSAAFELVPCDAEGKLTSNGGEWTYIPWDNERVIPQFVHTMTQAGLLWKHYEAVRTPKGEHFRLRLCWPKSRMQGECYFTDIRLTTASPGKSGVPAAEEKAGATTVELPYTLEISTADTGNLFYSDDPLRFDFLLYDPSGKALGALAAPVIRYAVTDYEHHRIAGGELPFAEAKTIAVGKRDTKARQRKNNLYVSAELPAGPAKAVGREFFLEAEVVDGGRVLARDIVTYGVVAPRPTPEEVIEKSRFIAFAHGGGFRNSESKHAKQSVADKMGVSLTHSWDYNGWRKAQPKKGSPITIPKGPDHPKLVYCPNLEQIRGRKPNHPWGDMSRNAPDWAIIDDPFHPGCRGFQIDGYVEYICEYVRVNRHRIVQVVPSGLERTIDARTLELQRKVYKKLKAEFPDLPVGMMVWGILSESGRELILKEKLYEVADFFDTHVYLSAVDWTEWEKLQKRFKKMGITRRLISTEFARVGGTDQLQRARDIITSNLDAHAHDMFRVTNFLMYVGNNQPIRNTVLRGDYPGDGFQWMQYVDRPRISPRIEGKNWRNGLYGKDFRGSSLMPMLHTMAYYNLAQNTECADFQCVFQPTDRSIAYVYARDEKTMLYLFLREPATPATLRLKGEVPYTMQDLYGRTDRVSPAGSSLVVATLDPLALQFEATVPALHSAASAQEVLAPVPGGVTLPVIARGASGTATVTVPPVFGRSLDLRVEATVDGRWPETSPQTIQVDADEAGTAQLPITVATNQAPASYTFTTRLFEGGTLRSVLKQPLSVSEILTVTLQGRPMTKTHDPAIEVVVKSLADQPMAGTVRLSNIYFGTGLTPTPLAATYRVAPRGSAVVAIPVPREQVNLSSSYLITATLEDESGFAVKIQDDVSFQACEKAKAPINVDGDLADWNLDELLPIPFERWMRGPRPAEDFSGHFYTRWDDEKVYFAAVITDSVPVVTGEKQIEWNDDNIMFCLYPWRWHMGTPLNTGYYREHLGPLKGGGASFMRVGYVPSGPATPEGAEIAVKRVGTQWFYEWAYPKESVYPLDLKPGGGFRLSMSVWDQHQVEKKGWGKFSWLTIGGFNTSVNAQPDKWRQFTFVE